MQTLEATFRIVTPMFIGGADKTREDCVRPPSVKGALRFWWRALNWGRFRCECANDALALKKLHDAEARLFGLAANGEGKGGQGCFLLTVRHDKLTTKTEGEVHDKFKPTRLRLNNPNQTDETHLAAARYLGYGLMTAFTSKDSQTKAIKFHAGELKRGCLDEEQIFTVVFIFHDKADDSIRDALILLGLLGGFGSRSRHGMGSIALEKIIHRMKEVTEEIWSAPKTIDLYTSAIKELIRKYNINVPQPEYSAFSMDTRVDYLLTAKTSYEVLDAFGTAMLRYRSWGKDGMVLGQTSEKRFEPDHHWYRNMVDPITKMTWRKSHKTFHPERIVFGLPHNYDEDARYHVTPQEHERRASPLLFHVHRLNNQYIGVSIFLKSRFLPQNEEINVGGNSVAQHIDCIEMTVITNFLDGKIGNPPTATNRFPHKKAILP